MSTLIFVDIETTGLDPEKDVMLELGMAAVDASTLDVLAEDSWVIDVPEATIARMDGIVWEMHRKSRLIEEILAGVGWDLADVEKHAIGFVETFGGGRPSPMAGSSVHFDRSFIQRSMPSLHEHFTYRNIDVSTLKELATAWAGESFVANRPKATAAHRALPDLHDTIEELRYYRYNLMTV